MGRTDIKIVKRPNIWRTSGVGPQGAPGVVVPILHEQTTPASSWLIAHGLGRLPTVTLIDEDGYSWSPDVRYVDDNTVMLFFPAPTTGKASLL